MPIVLLTDFGLQDAYVGTLKGVISTLAPDAPVLDLTHNVPAFDVREAGFLLYQSYSYFPKGSIFVAVVDPGVGSDRKHLLVKTLNYYFIAPDNGILSLVLAHEKVLEVRVLENPKYFLKNLSSTFHGRDVFAPVAAHLFNRLSKKQKGLQVFGPSLKKWVLIPDYFPQNAQDKIHGIILSIDHFGNAITNISKNFLISKFNSLNFKLKVKNKTIAALRNHYAEGKERESFLVFGNSGFLEIAVYLGSAAQSLGLKKGMTVSLSAC